MARKILIIEDEEDLANIMAKRLRNAGYEVVVTYDGILGLDQANKQLPDLIVLDLRLPGGNGFSVLSRIRKSLRTKDVPVVIQTGNRDEEEKRRVMELGVSAYIEKPYTADTLVNAIIQILQSDKEIKLDYPL